MATSDQKMLIGEVARRTGLKPKTIRFYEEVGLLPPPARSDSRYRLYPAEAVEQLAFIRTAQNLGLTLAEIKGLLERRRRGGPPWDYVGQVLRKKIAQIDDDMAMLHHAREALEEALAHWENRCTRSGTALAAAICSCIETAARPSAGNQRP